MSLNRHAKRRDENEPAIVAYLEANGALVYRLDRPVDLLVGYRGAWYLLEVKNPGAARGRATATKLTPDQEEFTGQAKLNRLPVSVVESPEGALAAIRPA